MPYTSEVVSLDIVPFCQCLLASMNKYANSMPSGDHKQICKLNINNPLHVFVSSFPIASVLKPSFISHEREWSGVSANGIEALCKLCPNCNINNSNGIKICFVKMHDSSVI